MKMVARDNGYIATMGSSVEKEVGVSLPGFETNDGGQ